MSTTDDSRNDRQMSHFISRAQQPRVLAAGLPAASQTPISIYIVYDQPFGNLSGELDGTRFRYVGTNPPK